MVRLTDSEINAIEESVCSLTDLKQRDLPYYRPQGQSGGRRNKENVGKIFIVVSVGRNG